MLHVTVVKASNLRKKDLLGKSDPYVKLFFGGQGSFAKVTRTIKSNLNPEWNESFKLTVTSPETQALEIHMYDWEKVSFSTRRSL
jgi:Ca2+-dependent lipid-binding protein